MGKANIYFKNGKWNIDGQFGTRVAEFLQDGLRLPGTGTLSNANIGTLATLEKARIGGLHYLTGVLKATGTTPGVSSIGSAAVTTVTLTNVASLGLAVGDLILANPKQALAGHIAYGGAHVPTTNVVNIYLANTKPDSAGSAPAIGWDIMMLRGSSS